MINDTNLVNKLTETIKSLPDDIIVNAIKEIENENKIEEAIERLEKSIENIWFCTTYSQEQGKKDLKILLSDYKRVSERNKVLLKENKTLKNFMKDLFDDENIIENDYVLKDDIRDAMKKYEWATKSYDCDEADYKQSQAIGAWFALLNLINKKGE